MDYEYWKTPEYKNEIEQQKKLHTEKIGRLYKKLENQITIIDYKKIIYINEILMSYLKLNISSIILEYVIIQSPLYLVEVMQIGNQYTFHSIHFNKQDAYDMIEKRDTLDWYDAGEISIICNNDKLPLLRFDHNGISTRYDE